MTKIPLIKSHTAICELWLALGGPKLRGNRGQAHWRGGTHYSVALDCRRGLWFDHAAGEGGDSVSLVMKVRACDFREAVSWLADFVGMPVTHDVADRHDVAGRNVAGRHEAGRHEDWHTDLRWAGWWAIVAEGLAEEALADLAPWHPERRRLTTLLNDIRLGPASLVNTYRAWRIREPALTRAMCLAGRRADVRMQRQLAEDIWESANA